MATRITKRDIERVYAFIEEAVGPCTRRPDGLVTNEDRLKILIGGWPHFAGWSRGFTVANSAVYNLKPDGSSGDLRGKQFFRGSVHDGGRYRGRGWHHRMANTIVGVVKECRRRMECSKCGGSGWEGQCDCDPDGRYHCWGMGTCGMHECDHQETS